MEALGFAGAAGVFDVLFDVVAEVAAVAEVGEIFGADVVLVVLVGGGGKGLAEVGGGEDDAGSGDGMRMLVLGTAPFAETLRPAADGTNHTPPVCRVAFPIDWHDQIRRSLDWEACSAFSWVRPWEMLNARPQLGQFCFGAT